MFPVGEGSPLMIGYLQGMQARNLGAQAKTEEEKLKSLPELLKAQLMAEQERARGMGITNDYLPQNLQSEIGVRNAQIPLMGAQTSHLNAQTAGIPFDQMLEAQRAYNQAQQLQQSQSRFGQAYQWSRFLQTPEGQKAIADNPQLAEAGNRVMAGVADSADQEVISRLSGQGQSNYNPSILPAFQTFMQQKYGLSPSQQELHPLLSKEEVNAKLGITPQGNANQQDVAASSVEKKTVPTATLQQRTYDRSAENMINKLGPLKKNAFSYSGPSGQSAAFIDEILSAVGFKMPQSYKDYVAFEQGSGFLANEIGRSLGVHHTDTQTKELKEIANPIKKLTSPEMATLKYNTNLDMLKQNQQAINESAGQLKQGGNPMPVEIPTFKSQQDAVNWYATATPEQKAQYRAMRGS